MSIAAYMDRHAFGDYRHAPAAVRMDRESAADLINLTSADAITPEQSQDYRARHGWSPRKR